MNTDNYALITKEFARTIWTKFIKALEEYHLIDDGDIIYLHKTDDAKQTLANRLVEMTARYKMRSITITYDRDAEYNKTVENDSFHDIIYNNLWEMVYNGRIHSKVPKYQKEGHVTTIRPLCLIRDEHIQEWQQATGEEFLEPAMTVEKEQLAHIKSIVDKLAANNDSVENNIFASMSNVDIEMLPGHIEDGIYHNFLEWYNQES